MNETPLTRAGRHTPESPPPASPDRISQALSESSIGRIDGTGTLNIGAPADVSILEIVDEPVTFVDTVNNQRRGTRFLRPVDTVRAGRPFGRPYPSPFTYPGW